MNNSFDVSGMLALDAQGIDKLRLLAKKDTRQALQGTARQFEALFMNMLLKSMREATPRDGMFDSEQTRFYTSMLDQQLAQSLSAKGVGLADIMVRQLSRPADTVRSEAQPGVGGGTKTRFPLTGNFIANESARPRDTLAERPVAGTGAKARYPQTAGFASNESAHPAVPNAQLPSAPGVPRRVIFRDGVFRGGQSRLPASRLDPQLVQQLSAQGIDNLIRQLTRVVVPGAPQQSAPAAAPAANTVSTPPSGAVVPPAARDFVNKVWTYAREASQATGIPAHFVVAQAALESGWGRHEIRRRDGSQSFNLFGIKAGRDWSGPVVETVTTEYVNGVAQKTVGRFRAYGSYTEGFRDYANLLLSNPRYAALLERQDAAGFAHGLQRAGYATDPMYADKLTRILNGNTLRQSLTLKA